MATVALGPIPAHPLTAWCPTSNLLAVESGAVPGDAAVFVLDASCPEVCPLPAQSPCCPVEPEPNSPELCTRYKRAIKTLLLTPNRAHLSIL